MHASSGIEPEASNVFITTSLIHQPFFLFPLFRCTMRIVDSFGTEPEYNFPSYATRKKMKSEWGKWNFFPKQFNTMFREYDDFCETLSNWG